MDMLLPAENVDEDVEWFANIAPVYDAVDNCLERCEEEMDAFREDYIHDGLTHLEVKHVSGQNCGSLYELEEWLRVFSLIFRKMVAIFRGDPVFQELDEYEAYNLNLDVDPKLFDWSIACIPSHITQDLKEWLLIYDNLLVRAHYFCKTLEEFELPLGMTTALMCVENMSQEDNRAYLHRTHLDYCRLEQDYASHVRCSRLIPQVRQDTLVELRSRINTGETILDEANMSVIERTITLSSNPLRRAWEFVRWEVAKNYVV